MSRAQREGGFTILELIIVMGISLFGLAGLMSIYSSTAGSTADDDRLNEAMDIAELSLEGLRQMTIDDIEDTYGTVSGVGFGPEAHHQGALEGRVGVLYRRDVWARAISLDGDLMRFQVDVRWNDDGSDPDVNDDDPHSITLEMLRSRQDEM